MRFRLTILGVLVVFCVFTACTSTLVNNSVNITPANTNTSENVNILMKVNINTAVVNHNVSADENINTESETLISPIDKPIERVTKKLFGTYVTPKNSPVQHERFTGYHTGIDFETFSSEVKTDVLVQAACTGKVSAAQHVSGYGGVLVQQCVINNQAVTVLYGHLRLSSITIKVGDTLKANTRFAVLGTGNSAETDGERKHLHFSIHKGTTIVWKGYVSSEAALRDWLDPMMYLPK